MNYNYYATKFHDYHHTIVGPSTWDIGSDLKQSKDYLDGTNYIKIVNDKDSPAITNFSCNLKGDSWKMRLALNIVIIKKSKNVTLS